MLALDAAEGVHIVRAVSVGFHIAFRARDERVLAPDAARRRAFAQVVKEVGRPRGLYAFGLADRHGHAALHGASAPVAEFMQYTALALRSRLGAPVVGRLIREVRDGHHEESLIGYCHTQDVHHGAHLDPLREGTSLPDLFGLRPDGHWLAARVRELAPQLDRRALLGQWGLQDLAPAGPPANLAELEDCGAAAVGLPNLDKRSAASRAARRACVEVAGPSATLESLAEALHVHARTIRRLRESPADARLVQAIRLQLALRVSLPVPSEPFAEPPPPRARRHPPQ